MDVTGCPSEPELLAFHLGTAPAETLDKVADHLECCPQCEAALQELDACSDQVLAALRKPVSPERTQGSNGRKETADFHDPTAREHWPSLPGYEILAVLGKGGMGVVYRARHLRLNRLVALKRLRSQSGQELARSRAEAEVLAQLQHPNIVQIFELVEQEGQAYLTMELVEGGSLSQRLTGKPQPPHRTAELLEMLARAVQYAHDRGIVHRDLKPSNVLLMSSYDPTGSDGKAASSVRARGNEWVPKLTDFGIAKRLAVDSGATQEGEILGTPTYMAPEQAGGKNREIGPATDLYSLGVILYEMLTGRVPLQGPTTHDTLMLVRTEEPVPPRRLQPKVPRDLETICLKCLEKEPGRRYASALALAEDLWCFQQGKPIQARPVGAPARLLRWCRRRPLVALLLALLTLSLFGGLAGVTWKWLEANNEKREAQFQAYRARIAAAIAALSMHDVVDAERQLEAAPEELRGWEWRHLYSRLDDSSTVIPLPLGGSGILISGPNRLRVGIVSGDGLRLADLDGGEHGTVPIRAKNPHTVTAAETSRGLRIAVSLEGAFEVFDEAGQRLCRVETPGDTPPRVALSPDGARLAWVRKEGEWRRVVVCDATTGKPTVVCEGHRGVLWSSAFSPDGKRLATGGDDKTARLWDSATGALLATCRGHLKEVVSVAFSPDSTRLLTTSGDSTARQWDVTTGGEVEPPYDRHLDLVIAAAYSPDGQWVASAGSDRTVRVWEARGRHDVAVLHGHTGQVIGVAFAPDGRRLASLSCSSVLDFEGWEPPGDDTVRVWEADPQAMLPVLRDHTNNVYPVVFSPDGRWIASGSWDHTVRLWDAATGAPCAVLPHPGRVHGLAYGPDGTWLVTACTADNRLRIWDMATARLRKEIALPDGSLRTVIVRPDGRRLAASAYVAENLHHLHVFDIASGKRLFSMPGSVRAYSPDGRWLAVVNAEEDLLLLLDAETNETVARFRGHEGYIHFAAFSPDSRRLATCGADRTIRLWQIDPLTFSSLPDERKERIVRECQVLRGHTDNVFAVAFHPDGTRLASAGRDRAVWLWDLERGEEVARLQGHTKMVFSLSFSPDGATLASGSEDNTVRLWDTAPLKTRYQARRAIEALRPEAEQVVDRLFREKKEASRVAQAVKEDKELSELLRRAAFHALLRRRQAKH